MFEGTTKSLLPLARDLEIHRERALVDFVIQYEHQLETPGQIADRALLENALHLLEERIATGEVDEELVHLAPPVYYPLQRWQQLRQILSQYRRQALSVYEEAWARWCEIDCCAMERECALVVTLQEALFQWALQSLPPEHCLSLMNDGTQALCWMMEGQQHQWLEAFENLMSQVTPTAANREDRFLYLRTAVSVVLRSGQSQEVLPFLSQLDQLLEEDPSDEHFRMEVYAMHLKSIGAQGSEAELHHTIAQAQQLLQEWKSSRTPPTDEEKRRRRSQCHNFGASLFRLHHYELALPFFEQAIQYGASTPHTYMWLAASYWVTTQEQRRVLALLKQAKEHDASGEIAHTIAELPELQDLFETLHLSE